MTRLACKSILCDMSFSLVVLILAVLALVSFWRDMRKMQAEGVNSTCICGQPSLNGVCSVKDCWWVKNVLKGR